MVKFLIFSRAIWAVLSLPFVNGSFITRNAGSCASNEFWYEPIQDCIHLGSQSVQHVPPYGVKCPLNGWYWSSRLSACLPTSPVVDVSSPGTVPCPLHYTWDPTTSSCAQNVAIQRSTSCDVTEFWFSEEATCLPRRDVRIASTRCPSGWYWRTESTNCVPASPEALLTVTCRGDLVWSPSTLMCQRAASIPSRSTPSSAPSWRPSPSSSPGRLSHRKSRTVRLCPATLDACPISGSGNKSDYECIDPKYDLQHCGGCSVDGRGQDCTSIEGIRNVECTHARCSGPWLPSESPESSENPSSVELHDRIYSEHRSTDLCIENKIVV